jgi:hypothetical protein
MDSDGRTSGFVGVCAAPKAFGAAYNKPSIGFNTPVVGRVLPRRARDLEPFGPELMAEGLAETAPRGVPFITCPNRVAQDLTCANSNCDSDSSRCSTAMRALGILSNHVHGNC